MKKKKREKPSNSRDKRETEERADDEKANVKTFGDRETERKRESHLIRNSI